MMFIPRLGQGNGLFAIGSMTKGSWFTGFEYAHGYSNGSGAIGGDAFGSLSGGTALDGSGYQIYGLFTYPPSGIYITYLYIYMPVTGGSETKTSVFNSITINGVTKTAASANSFAHISGDVYQWAWNGADEFALAGVADTTALPFSAPVFVA